MNLSLAENMRSPSFAAFLLLCNIWPVFSPKYTFFLAGQEINLFILIAAVRWFLSP